MTGGLADRMLRSVTQETSERPDSAPPAPPLPRGAIDLDERAQPVGGGSIWTATRVVGFVLTVLQTFLLLRFALLLFGANPDHPLVSFVYGITEPIVRPFQGILAQPEGPPTIDVAALLAILFFLLLGALVVAGVRAITGRRAGPRQSV